MNTTPQHTMEQKHTNIMLYTAFEITNKKCYTSGAKKKRTCLSRSTNTLANSRQRNHEERTHKSCFFFSSLAHLTEVALRRAKLKNKRVGIFFQSRNFIFVLLSWNVIEHASTKREARFFFSFLCSRSHLAKRKWKRKAKRFCSFLFSFQLDFQRRRKQ